jgi:hypothetical protein
MPRSTLFRLSRPLGAAVVLVSAVACAACVALWVSSFWTASSCLCNVGGFAFWLNSERNLVELDLHAYRDGDEPSGGGLYPNPDYKTQFGSWGELQPLRNPPPGTFVYGRPFSRNVREYLLPAIGLGYRKTQYANERASYSVYVPHWLGALAFALLPTVWYVRVVRPRRRSVAGCCVRCGYDLRATPAQCPECGTPATANAVRQPAGA